MYRPGEVAERLAASCAASGRADAPGRVCSGEVVEHSALGIRHGAQP
jgi:hypothetical protein